jgi:hypothetical protein
LFKFEIIGTGGWLSAARNQITAAPSESSPHAPSVGADFNLITFIPQDARSLSDLILMQSVSRVARNY